MEAGNKRWVKLLLWCILQFVKCSPQTPTKQQCLNPNYLPMFREIIVGDYCEKIHSSMDCSQEPRKDIEYDFPLHCKVGRKKEWGLYNETISEPLRCSVDECQPPELSSLHIEWMRIPSGSRIIHHPTFKLDFFIPKANPDRNFYTGAILMTFSSSNDREVGDKGFPTRYRLMNFSDYTYSSPDNDRNYQRHLNFSCFIGYQHEPCQSDDYKVYTVTFTAYSKIKTSSNETVYSQLAYDFTIYTYYVYHQRLWKPTIAIAKYPDLHDVTVVFDPAPNEYSVNKYEISLVDAIKNTTIKQTTIHKSKKYNCEFLNLSDGRYYIVVTTIREECQISNCRNATKSHEFAIGQIQENGSLFTHSKKEMLVVSIGSGIVLALALVGLLCYCKKRRDHMESKLKETFQRPKCLLVYSNRNETNCEIAREFVKCCRNQLQVDVIFDEEEEAKLVPNVPAWYKEKFRISSIAIILWFPGSDRKHETINVYRPIQDFFNMAATIALNKKHNDGLKIACVYFDPSHRKSISEDFRNETKIFLVMKDLKKLHRYLHGNKNVPFKCTQNSVLQQIIDKSKQNNRVNEFELTEVETQERDPLIEVKEEITSFTEQPGKCNYLLDENDKNEHPQDIFKDVESLKSSLNSETSFETRFTNPDCPIHGLRTKSFTIQNTCERNQSKTCPLSPVKQQTHESDALQYQGPNMPIHESHSHSHFPSRGTHPRLPHNQSAIPVYHHSDISPNRERTKTPYSEANPHFERMHFPHSKISVQCERTYPPRSEVNPHCERMHPHHLENNTPLDRIRLPHLEVNPHREGMHLPQLLSSQHCKQMHHHPVESSEFYRGRDNTNTNLPHFYLPDTFATDIIETPPFIHNPQYARGTSYQPISPTVHSDDENTTFDAHTDFHQITFNVLSEEQNMPLNLNFQKAIPERRLSVDPETAVHADCNQSYTSSSYVNQNIPVQSKTSNGISTHRQGSDEQQIEVESCHLDDSINYSRKSESISSSDLDNEFLEFI